MIAVLMDNKEPAKTMAWLLVLCFFPVIGIILYFFFGQKIRRERLFSQRSINQLDKHSMLEYVEQKNLTIPEEYSALIHLFINQDMALPFRYSSADIYTDGYSFFQSLLFEIGAAQNHIHIDTFIIEDDSLGRLISDALIDKAKQGVEVRLIYDDVGCWSVPNRFFEHLRKGGVEVHSFMPVKFPMFTSKANYRNHRKLIVIDGTVGFIGGMNIALRYIKGTAEQSWRDTHIKVRGGAVYAIQRAFIVDWYFVDRTLYSSNKYYPHQPLEINKYSIAQVVTSSPISPWSNIMQGYVNILQNAKHYVYMESPYFLPNEPVLFAMQTAALAGIDVKLMIPEKGDSKIVEIASRTYLQNVIEAGVKVYLYKSGFNHSKLLVCDDNLSTCGSTNIDFRSFDHDFESNIFFYDKPMALRMKQIFIEDLSFCKLIDTVSGLPRRPFLQRLWESTVRLLSPLL